MALYALDTSAILAFLYDEPGEERVNELLAEALRVNTSTVLLPFMALMEVEYKLRRVLSETDVEHWLITISNWPVEVVESSTQWRQEAARIKASFRLSLADAWIAALALLRDAELVHKDPEFDAVPGLRAVRLPYEPGAS